jgi:type VI secretion system secreted protein VgrG
VHNPNEAARLPFVTNVHVASRVRPGLYSARDFDFRRPEYLLLKESEKAPEKEGTYEQYHYSPGGFLIETLAPKEPVADDHSVARHDDREGERHVKIGFEGERFKKRYVDFESNALELRPGAAFTMEHPRNDLKDKKLVVVESQCNGNATGEFSVTGVAVFAEDPFRIPKKTPRPRIDGLQSAIVVGPLKDEIYTDEHGRVRLRFHWDREGEFDDNRTCWVRVSQGWAGPGFGAMMIPRVDHEVLVDFLDGDPDHPVVVGRVYNLTSPAPYILPKHQTQSTWKTQTSPFEDGAFNELMFEDAAQKELVFVQGQRNMMKLVKHDETRRVGKERVDVVGQHRLGVVAGVDALHVGEQHLVKMVKPGDLKILRMEDPSVSQRQTWIELKDEKITLTTGKASIVLQGGDIVIEARGGVRFSADKQIIIKGGDVYFNDKGGKSALGDAGKEVDDQVEKPVDRTKVVVLELAANSEKAAAAIDRTFGFKKKPYKEPPPVEAKKPKPKPTTAHVQPSAEPGTIVKVNGQSGTAPMARVTVPPGAKVTVQFFKPNSPNAPYKTVEVTVPAGGVEFVEGAP